MTNTPNTPNTTPTLDTARARLSKAIIIAHKQGTGSRRICNLAAAAIRRGDGWAANDALDHWDRMYG